MFGGPAHRSATKPRLRSLEARMERRTDSCGRSVVRSGAGSFAIDQLVLGPKRFEHVTEDCRRFCPCWIASYPNRVDLCRTGFGEGLEAAIGDQLTALSLRDSPTGFLVNYNEF